MIAKKASFASVDEYIAIFPEETQKYWKRYAPPLKLLKTKVFKNENVLLYYAPDKK